MENLFRVRFFVLYVNESFAAYLGMRACAQLVALFDA